MIVMIQTCERMWVVWEPLTLVPELPRRYVWDEIGHSGIRNNVNCSSTVVVVLVCLRCQEWKWEAPWVVPMCNTIKTRPDKADMVESDRVKVVLRGSSHENNNVCKAYDKKVFMARTKALWMFFCLCVSSYTLSKSFGRENVKTLFHVSR